MDKRGAVHQFVPVLAARDAIGRHVFTAQRLLREAGYESDIFADELRPEVVGLARSRDQFSGGSAGHTWLLYHCSTGSDMGLELAQRAEPLILDYHNITPAELFIPWEPWVGGQMRLARHQLAEIAPRAIGGLADSSFNAAELRGFGCPRAVVAPILLDWADFDGSADEQTLSGLQAVKRSGGADWLFVGRIAPNKAQHELVSALAAYRELFDPHARLWLVGGSSSHHYLTRLAEMVRELGLSDAVHLVGSVPHSRLLAYYAAADVFVCVSDHEGFSVPVVEAMHTGVPVVAFNAGAVPETVGAGGLLIHDKRPLDVAAAVARVLREPGLREVLVRAGHRRASELGLERTGPRFVAAVEAVTR